MADQQKKENVFAEGFYFEKPHEKAPEFVKGKISIKVAEFIPFLEKHKNGGGYVNLDLKKAKSGKLYVALNDYNGGKSKPLTEDEIAMSVPPIEDKPKDQPPF